VTVSATAGTAVSATAAAASTENIVSVRRMIPPQVIAVVDR
jgi:hypothetical protein